MNYFLASALPEPPHFSQFFPSLAASAQHSWSQALPFFSAFWQQPACFDSAESDPLAKANPAVRKEATSKERRILGSFIF